MDCISQVMVKTRKEHRCWGCGRTFPKGTKLERLTNVDGGEITTTYWCDTCRQYWTLFLNHDDEGINMGDLRAEDPKEWERLRREIEDLSDQVKDHAGETKALADIKAIAKELQHGQNGAR